MSSENSETRDRILGAAWTLLEERSGSGVRIGVRAGPVTAVPHPNQPYFNRIGRGMALQANIAEATDREHLVADDACDFLDEFRVERGCEADSLGERRHGDAHGWGDVTDIADIAESTCAGFVRQGLDLRRHACRFQAGGFLQVGGLVHDRVDKCDDRFALAASDTLGRAVWSLAFSGGTTLVIDEEQMIPATALCACGIAFFLRAVRAASQGGIEIGWSAPSGRNSLLRLSLPPTRTKFRVPGLAASASAAAGSLTSSAAFSVGDSTSAGNRIVKVAPGRGRWRLSCLLATRVLESDT